jgi:hypothetical protein
LLPLLLALLLLLLLLLGKHPVGGKKGRYLFATSMLKSTMTQQ